MLPLRWLERVVESSAFPCGDETTQLHNILREEEEGVVRTRCTNSNSNHQF